jgi:hypothetical protein
LPAVISLYAANTVDGGQIMSISPTDSRHGAVIRRASRAQSTYRSVSSAAGTRSTWWARNSATSIYGGSGASVMPRRMSQRNGTSAWQTATSSGISAAAASASPPPWLIPVTATRAAPASAQAVSTARTASLNRRV